jgi:hypothetical protein
MNIEQKTEKFIFDKFAKTNGYEETPPTIDEFLNSDYYMGDITNEGKAIYPYWKEFLREMYKTPFYEFDDVTKIIILSGSTGTGKCLDKNQELEFEISEELVKDLDLEKYLFKEK